ncbi:hypothetical protein [Sphingomonas endolithica]|uniref:hypothetical protein n=1 Tax=Sphingomonas endolithica TaxID=2972485 RepID=UPI0021AF5222|nr:hypothetical protein [Sphingomonas sp. ZFBP2030]
MATTPTTRKPRQPAAGRTTAAKSAAAKSAAAKPATRTRKPAAKAAPARTFDTTTVLSIGGALVAVGAAVAGFLARRQISAWVAPGSAEHAAPDLAADKPHPGPDDRAPVAFRPDMDAPMSPAEREALRPATGPAPSLVAEAGTMNSQTGASN